MHTQEKMQSKDLKQEGNYETDSRSIPLEQLIRLAIYYETSLDYLANLTDNKKPYPHGKHAPKK